MYITMFTDKKLAEETNIKEGLKQSTNQKEICHNNQIEKLYHIQTQSCFMENVYYIFW